MTRPRASVIVPMYNASSFVRGTLESVVAQGFDDWELIVVDDGSTDGSLDIVREFEVNRRVKVMSQANAGVATARNHGLAMARGGFVAFLDADDVWLPGNLGPKVAFLEDHSDVGLVQADVQVVDTSTRPSGPPLVGSEGWVLEALLEWRGDPIPLLPSNAVFPRKVLDVLGGFDPEFSTAADQDLKFRLAARYPVARVAGVQVLYRVHGANMHMNVLRMERDHRAVYDKATRLGLFKDAAFRRRCYSRLYSILAGSHWHAGSRSRALALGLRGIATSPGATTWLLAKALRAVLRG